MRIGLRQLIARIEVATLVVLVVTAPIVDLLEAFGVFQTSLGPTLLTIMVANAAALLITVDARVFDVARDVQTIRESVRPEVAVHREAVYDEINHLLLESSAEESSLPVRIYVPVGLLVPDAAWRRWNRSMADLVRRRRIVLSTVYVLAEERSTFDRLRQVIADDYADLEQEWITQNAAKGALFYVYPPSPLRPGIGVVLAGRETAVLVFPITPGYRGAENALVVRGERAVGGLVSWFDNQVRPGAQPVNTGRSIPAGFAALAEQYFRQAAT